MIHIDCPLCLGEAHTDEALTVVECDGCDARVEIAADPAVTLDLAA